MIDVHIRDREFVLHTCINCGVEFFLPKAMDTQHHADGATHYCPSGHGQVYGTTLKSTIERLRKDLGEAIGARDALEAKLRRVENGVCPECRRSFKDLHRHMKTKHRRKE